MGPFRSAVKQVFQFSALVVLLGAFATAQSNSVQEPRVSDRIGAMVSPVAPGQKGARGVNAGGPVGPGSGGTSPVQVTAESSTAGAPPSASAVPSSEMVIGAGDLLEVSVYGAPDYDKQVRVSSAGEITLPLAGTLKVGELTTSQAETLIEKRLSDGKFFTDPKVSVLAKDFASQGISVLGEVQKPGIYPLPGSRNLFDALSAAGGTTPRAGNTVSITHRSDPHNQEVAHLTYDGKSPDKANIPVYPGDTVVVSKAGVVYVTGDVHLPGGFIMENAHMTILQAVAMAQGANPTAALDRAKLIRNSAQGGEPQEIPISLKKILAAKAPDMDLQPNDIVFVPNSAAKSAGRRTLSAIVETATGMAVYGSM